MKYSKKSRYLNEYKLDENGKYVYKGRYFSIDDSPERIKSVYIKAWIFNIILIAAVIGSGCINAAGMNNTFYVIIPYIAEVAMLFAYSYNSFRLFSKGYRIKEYIYKTAFNKLSPFSMGIAIASAIGFICSLIYLITNGFDNQVVACISYLAFKLFVFFFAFATSRFAASLKWMEI